VSGTFGRHVEPQGADKRPVPYNEHVAFREVVAFLVLAGAFCLFVVTTLFAIGRLTSRMI
jgi:hypothetical protein